MTPARNGKEEGGPSQESGQISVLTMAYFALTAALILVIASVSAAYLERRALQNLADSMAYHAAHQLNVSAYYLEGLDVKAALRLSEEVVDRATIDYLAAAPPEMIDFEDLQVLPTTGPLPGQGAQVVLSARVRPLFDLWVLDGFSDGFMVEVQAQAQAVENGE